MKSTAIERTKTAVIIFLLLLIFILLFFIFNTGAAKAPPFKEAVKNKEAKENIKTYRDMWSGSVHKKTKGVVYDSATIRDYIVDTFPMLKAKYAKLAEYQSKGYELAVGFYFMRKENQSGKPRNSFFVVPTFVKKNEKQEITEVVDFFENPEEYVHKASKIADDDKNSYDAGHLWP